MNITLKQLKIFLSIVNHNNMTAAAKSLHMTKGALSQNLAELENQLGTQLFDRQHSRLHINQTGQQLIPLADELLARVKFIGDKFENTNTSPKIKIGCTKSIGCFLLPGILRLFEKRAGWLPEVALENNHTIHGMLNRFELDIALLEGPVMEPSLQSELWMTDEMVVVASQHHPLANEKRVSYTQLEQECWILRENGSASRSFFDNQLALKLNNPKVTLSLNSFDAILLSVYHQLGITFISKACLSSPLTSQSFTHLKTDHLFFRNFNIVYQPEKYLSPPVQEWLDFIKKWAHEQQRNHTEN